MRKIMFLSIAFLFSASLIFGQSEKKLKELIKEKKEEIKNDKEEIKADKAQLKKLNTDDVNFRVKESFIQDFGELDDVKWESTDNFDKAVFTKDGKNFTAFYDFEAGLIGTINQIPFAELPVKAQDEINEKYKDYTIGAVIYFDNNDAVNTHLFYYDSPFENEDNYFVELTDNSKTIVLIVSQEGDVSFFKYLN